MIVPVVSRAKMCFATRLKKTTFESFGISRVEVNFEVRRSTVNIRYCIIFGFGKTRIANVDSSMKVHLMNFPGCPNCHDNFGVSKLDHSDIIEDDKKAIWLVFE